MLNRFLSGFVSPLKALNKRKSKSRNGVISEHHHLSSKVEIIKMQHDKIVSKRNDTNNQLIEAKDTGMRHIVMSKDKQIDKLFPRKSTAKAKFITGNDKVIESTLALKNTEISMLITVRDKDFDKMLEIFKEKVPDSTHLLFCQLIDLTDLCIYPNTFIVLHCLFKSTH